MKPFKLSLILIIVLSISFSNSLLAQAKKEIKKEYEAKEKIKIDLALGSCTIKNSTDGKIHVHVVYSYDDESFEPRFREKSNTLYLEEKFYGNNPRGQSDWMLEIPKDVKIDFNSGTGDLYIEGKSEEIEGNTGTGNIEITLSKSEFDLNTGTGNIEVVDSEGDFALNSGTGRVRIKNSKGDFKANSGTGDVEASDITIISDGNFNSGTGDAEVKLPKGDDFDLSINSGTGDALLDMKGSPIVGYFEFSAHARKGSIKSPVDFDEEEEYWQGDSQYIRKSFTKEKDTPRFYISTGTGTAELKK